MGLGRASNDKELVKAYVKVLKQFLTSGGRWRMLAAKQL